MLVESCRMGRLEYSLGGICCMGFEDSLVVAVDFLDIVGIVRNIQGHFDLVKTASKTIDYSSHLFLLTPRSYARADIFSIFFLQSTSPATFAIF